MANGSYRLDLKRDEARTLMLKMDARLTYAGRERNAACQLEGERELRHIDYARQLITADFNRARREIQRRVDFFQTLQEQNRERRKKRDIAWCDEEEQDWERKARAARRRRTLPKIKVYKNHKADAIGSIRRDQKKEFAGKMTHEMKLNRSLDALTNSYAKRKSRNEATAADVDEPDVGKSPKPSLDEPKTSKSKYKIPTQTISLPELSVGKTGPGSLPKKGSLSQMISSSEICKLPGIVVKGDQQSDAAQTRRMSITSSFYVNTSTNAQEVTANNQVSVPTSGRRRVSIVDPSTQTRTRRVPALSPGPQKNIPLRFYEQEVNPFLSGDVTPTTNRSNDLINSNKADEMYIWLGFESEDEFEKLQRGELVNEDGSETSSNVDELAVSDHRLHQLRDLADL